MRVSTLLLLVLGAAMCVTDFGIGREIIKPEVDTNEYKCVVLLNRMPVVLIRDERAEKLLVRINFDWYMLSKNRCSTGIFSFLDRKLRLRICEQDPRRYEDVWFRPTSLFNFSVNDGDSFITFTIPVKDMDARLKKMLECLRDTSFEEVLPERVEEIVAKVREGTALSDGEIEIFYHQVLLRSRGSVIICSSLGIDEMEKLVPFFYSLVSKAGYPPRRESDDEVAIKKQGFAVATGIGLGIRRGAYHMVLLKKLDDPIHASFAPLVMRLLDTRDTHGLHKILIKYNVDARPFNINGTRDHIHLVVDIYFNERNDRKHVESFMKELFAFLRRTVRVSEREFNAIVKASERDFARTRLDPEEIVERVSMGSLYYEPQDFLRYESVYGENSYGILTRLLREWLDPRAWQFSRNFGYEGDALNELLAEAIADEPSTGSSSEAKIFEYLAQEELGSNPENIHREAGGELKYHATADKHEDVSFSVLLRFNYSLTNQARVLVLAEMLGEAAYKNYGFLRLLNGAKLVYYLVHDGIIFEISGQSYGIVSAVRLFFEKISPGDVEELFVSSRERTKKLCEDFTHSSSFMLAYFLLPALEEGRTRIDPNAIPREIAGLTLDDVLSLKFTSLSIIGSGPAIRLEHSKLYSSIRDAFSFEDAEAAESRSPAAVGLRSHDGERSPVYLVYGFGSVSDERNITRALLLSYIFFSSAKFDEETVLCRRGIFPSVLNGKVYLNVRIVPSTKRDAPVDVDKLITGLLADDKEKLKTTESEIMEWIAEQFERMPDLEELWKVFFVQIACDDFRGYLKRLSSSLKPENLFSAARVIPSPRFVSYY
jgi:hypothetical protein